MPVVERNDSGGRRLERPHGRVVNSKVSNRRGKVDADATLHLTMEQVFNDSPDTLLLGVDQIVHPKRKSSATGSARGKASSPPQDMDAILAEIRRIITQGKTNTAVRRHRSSSPLLVLLLIALAVAYYFYTETDIWSWASEALP